MPAPGVSREVALLLTLMDRIWHKGTNDTDVLQTAGGLRRICKEESPSDLLKRNRAVVVDNEKLPRPEDYFVLQQKYTRALSECDQMAINNRRYEVNLRRKDGQLREKSQELRRALDERDAAVADRDALLKEKELLLTERAEALAVIKQQQGLLEERDERIREVQERVNHSQTSLEHAEAVVRAKESYTFAEVMCIAWLRCRRPNRVLKSLPVHNAALRLRDPSIPAISESTVKAWRQNDAYPAWAVAQLRDLEITEHSVRAELRPAKTRAGAFVWTKEDYLLGLRLLQNKKGLPAVCAAIPNATDGQINRKFNNDAPDERFLGPIAVASDGPMSYLELWKIGHALYDESWKKILVSRFGLSRNAIQWDEPAFLTAAQRQDLRQEWRQRPQRKVRTDVVAEAPAK